MRNNDQYLAIDVDFDAFCRHYRALAAAADADTAALFDPCLYRGATMLYDVAIATRATGSGGVELAKSKHEAGQRSLVGDATFEKCHAAVRQLFKMVS